MVIRGNNVLSLLAMFALAGCATTASMPPRPSPIPPPPPPPAPVALANGAASYGPGSTPQYPLQAIAEKEEGTAVGMFMRTKTGTTTFKGLERSSGFRLLDAAAEDAARHSVIPPLANDDVPKDRYARIPYNFTDPMSAEARKLVTTYVNDIGTAISSKLSQQKLDPRAYRCMVRIGQTPNGVITSVSVLRYCDFNIEDRGTLVKAIWSAGPLPTSGYGTYVRPSFLFDVVLR